MGPFPWILWIPWTLFIFSRGRFCGFRRFRGGGPFPWILWILFIFNRRPFPWIPRIPWIPWNLLMFSRGPFPWIPWVPWCGFLENLSDFSIFQSFVDFGKV